MKAGIIVNQGDPRAIADLAAEAEAAGWDGVFAYDAIAIGDAPMWDPWVVLAAIALPTWFVRLPKPEPRDGSARIGAEAQPWTHSASGSGRVRPDPR